jgi:hypothetical protein
VHYEDHWSLYCVNLVHGQIDILDPFPWTNDQDRDRCHGTIAGQIQGRLNAVFQKFTSGRFTDIFEMVFAICPYACP